MVRTREGEFFLQIVTSPAYPDDGNTANIFERVQLIKKRLYSGESSLIEERSHFACHLLEDLDGLEPATLQQGVAEYIEKRAKNHIDASIEHALQEVKEINRLAHMGYSPGKKRARY